MMPESTGGRGAPEGEGNSLPGVGRGCEVVPAEGRGGEQPGACVGRGAERQEPHSGSPEELRLEAVT